MKRIAILSLALAAPWLSPAADPVAYDRVFPQDTGVYMEMSDFARTKTRWQASPLGKAWETEDFKPIREKLDGLFDVEDEDAKEGMENLKKVSAHFTGRAAFGIGDMGGFMSFIEESFKLDEERKKITGGAVEMPDFEEDMEDAEPAAPAADAEDDGISAEDQAKLDALDAREEELIAKGLSGLMFMADIGANREALLKDLRALSEKSNAKADATTKEQIVEEKDGDRVFYVVKSEPVPGAEPEEKDDAEGPDLVFTFAGEHILLGLDKGSLGKAAAAVEKGGAASSLSGHADYARTRARLAEPDFVMFMDLGAVGRFLDKMMTTMEAKPNPMGVMPAQIAKALELDAIAPLGLVMKMEDKGLHSVMELGFTRETKLSKVLMPFARKAADKPVFIPKDVLSVSSMRVDLPGWYASMTDMLNGISPMFGMFLNMGLMSAQQNMGVDIKTGVIDALGDSIVYSQFLPGDEEKEAAIPGMAPLLVAIGLKDQAAIQNTLSKVSDKMGNGEEMITKNDYLGTPVYEIAGPAAAGAPVFSYAFLGDYMVMGIGSADALKAAIRTQKDPASSVWELADLKAFLATAPANAPALEYSRVQSMIEGWNKLMNMGTLGGQPDFEDLEEEDDAADAAEAKVEEELKNLDLKPFAKVIGNAFGTSRFEGGLMVSESFLRYADESADADNK